MQPHDERGPRREYPPVAPEDWPLDVVLGRLDGWRRCGDGYAALCPAHGDRRPSLAVREAEDGTVLIYCHAGCETEAVLDALGLTYANLFATEYTRRFGQRRGDRPIPFPFSALAKEGKELAGGVTAVTPSPRGRAPPGGGRAAPAVAHGRAGARSRRGGRPAPPSPVREGAAGLRPPARPARLG